MNTWPTVIAVGIAVLVTGTALAAFGVIAIMVENDRVAEFLLPRLALPVLFLGIFVLILGMVGWWALLVPVCLAVFAAVARPKRVTLR